MTTQKRPLSPALIGNLCGLAVAAALEWIGFWAWRQRGLSLRGVILLMVVTLIPVSNVILLLVRLSREGEKSSKQNFNASLRLIAALLYGTSVLTWGFAMAYWAHGSEFGPIQLSHLDAIYVALGTLSTAGTGSFVPATEQARSIVTVQLVVDLVYVLVILTLGINRLGERRNPLP